MLLLRSVLVSFFACCLFQQVHLGRQEQIRLKALREAGQLAADVEQARLDKEGFLAEEEREREKEMRKRQVCVGKSDLYDDFVVSYNSLFPVDCIYVS